MVNTATTMTPEKLAEKYSLYKEFDDQRRALEERLRRSDAEKESVNERIYKKVRAEYQKNLEEIEAKLAPLKSEIDEFRRESERELDELEKKIEALDDEHAEVGFRHRVGEFDDRRYQESTKRIKTELDELYAHRQQVTQQLASLGVEDNTADRGDTGRAGGAPTGAAKETKLQSAFGGLLESQRKKDAAGVTPPVPDEKGANTPDAGYEFENPQDWWDELGATKSADEPAAPIDKPSDEAKDALAAMADPATPKTADETSAPGGNQKRAAGGFPNLVIKSGANAGRRIPLLPMTMSIGREHDNNIELKDSDIARYHARVLFERGEFLLEDLESSSGTWVNGLAVKKAKLKNGDKLRFGSTEISIEFG